MVDVAASTTSAPVGANGNPLFTCMACHIAFHTAEHQRQHYRTDWHRYNLKRKVAQLAPVTAEQFAEKLLAQRAQLEEERAQAAFSDECLLCGKKFSSENAYAQHLRSKKHKETELRVAQGKQAPAKFRKRHPGLARVSNVNGDDDTASASDVISMADTMETVEDDNASTSANAVIDKYGMVDETASPDQVMDAINERINSAPRLGEGDCLFCTHKADTLQANIEHMVKKHSFFIPDAEYLVDLPGLISYLADKISVANICLYCNGRGRGLRSMEAVRQHMIDKGHTKIAYETERDILEISDFYDFRPSYPDYQERVKKTDENGNIIETDDDEEGELIRYSNDDYVIDEGYELRLPSGARIGHRSLRRYYKQYIRPQDDRESVMINRLLTQHAPQASSRAESECRALQLMSDALKRQVLSKQEWRRKHEYKTRVAIKANKLQRHFRQQVLF